MNTGARRTLLVLALQGAALVVLAWALLGGAWLDSRGQPQTLVLADRSQSMPRAEVDQALAALAGAGRAAGGGVPQVLAFAGRVQALPAAGAGAGAGAAAVDDLAPTATNIEAALQAALAVHAQAPLAQVVVVSDGHQTAGDATLALRAAREARLPVHWVALGRPPPPAHIAEVLAPARAQVGQRVSLTLQVNREDAGQLASPPVSPPISPPVSQPGPALQVKATARAGGGQTQAVYADVGPTGRVQIEFDARASGALIVDLALEAPAAGQTIHQLNDAAVVDIVPPAALLYVQGSSGPLAASLLRGGWRLNVVAAARLDEQTDALDGLQAVVLDDVAIADASPRFWSALVAAVNNRGLGLLVLGGERSFARGGYRHSTLESVLPVLAEPAALDQPAAVLFAVDKSGSMGQGSGGVDRFQLAQRAVLETARSLSERDLLGLLVFDAAPSLLVPLGPAGAGAVALARDWQTSPNGGTRLAPALDRAVTELERSSAPRRMLVLVTDGFVDSVPLVDLKARLARARIEVVALAVGPDADVGALQRVVGEDAGPVLRVDQAADLPTVMRSGLDRRRARVERGSIAVQQVQPLPFAPATLQDWPAIAAHHATRPRAGAVVTVQNRRGEPVLAHQQAGRGRVVAITSGLGAWTPQWWAWRDWPRLAGGLATWIGGVPPGAGPLVSGAAGGALQVEVEVPGPADDAGAASMSMAVDTPTARGVALALQHIAPGRVRAQLPDAGPGLYTFVVSTAQGTQRHLHLRRQSAEGSTWGTAAALADWRGAGLISAWAPGTQVPQRAAAERAVDRGLLALALVLFVLAVVLDRARVDRASALLALRRWRLRLLPNSGSAG